MRAGDEAGGRVEGRGVVWALAAVLAATVAVRVVGVDQPIVENYVGRQIPTAMVARNLERGSGVFRPRLDTAPLPNYFLVEPPLYGLGVVALRRATGAVLGLEASGRVLSAIATAVAVWGLFVLAFRRAGARVALLAAGAFAAFPVTIRYGRAFQPDMAMLGAVLAGLACWDRAIDPARPASRRAWLGAGWVLLAIGLALKVIVLPVVAVMAWQLEPRRRAARVVAVGAALVPALLWYVWAAHLVAAGGGSRASADNGTIWIALVAGSASALLDRGTWALVLRFVAVRAFTPIGAAMAAAGLIAARDAGAWRAWGLAAGITLAMLAPKLHHEYYFLLLAPAAAAGCGLALDRLALGRQRVMVAGVLALVAMGLIQARSTWRTPDEWAGLDAASRTVAQATGGEDWVVAPEALLFASDRRGCRLEWTEPAARRAAGEWGEADSRAIRGPEDLVAFYRDHGARYFADLGDRRDDPRRMALHDAVRRRYKVIVDRPEVIIADLEAVSTAGIMPHAN